MNSKKIFKCPLCGKKYVEKEGVLAHMENSHEDEIPQGKSANEYYYNLTKKKFFGKCIICGKHTQFNEKTGKYARFCGSKKCKDEYLKIVRKRMIGKYGKVNLLNDPEQQRKMLANRKISGEYRFVKKPGKPIAYTGSYELDFLKQCDLILDLKPDEINSPAPFNFYYEYEGKKHFYIPDFYLIPYNLLVEIKDGGDNPNKHHKIVEVDKVKERLKDDVMETQHKFNYIKIVNKVYNQFFDIINKIKENDNEQFVYIPDRR